MASKPLESLRSLWHLASTAFFWATLTRLKISSVCKSVGVIHISSDKNHVGPVSAVSFPVFLTHASKVNPFYDQNREKKYVNIKKICQKASKKCAPIRRTLSAYFFDVGVFFGIFEL